MDIGLIKKCLKTIVGIHCTFYFTVPAKEFMYIMMNLVV